MQKCKRQNSAKINWMKATVALKFSQRMSQVPNKNVVEPLKAIGPSSKKLSSGRRNELNRSLQTSSSSSIHTNIEDPGTNGIVPYVQVHLQCFYPSMTLCSMFISLILIVVV